MRCAAAVGHARLFVCGHIMSTVSDTKKSMVTPIQRVAQLGRSYLHAPALGSYSLLLAIACLVMIGGATRVAPMSPLDGPVHLVSLARLVTPGDEG
jgi:hypothetical protein